MNLLFPGAIIRRERIRRDWSQEGLCKGICAVSYLSKIEQGKTEASPEILRMLFARLELPWYDDEVTLAAAKSLVERCYEALFAGEEEALRLLGDEFFDREAHISNSPYALDAALLHGILDKSYEPAVKEMEPFLDQHQLALQRMMLGRHEEAVCLYPCAYIHLMAGIGAYEQGRSDAITLEYLHCAYDMAYAYFVQEEQPTMMDLHKLAICCEKSGRRAEAFEALDRAARMDVEYPDMQLSRQMCDLVRFRLEHGNYLQCPQYGEQLLHIFHKCRQEMPIGYAAFHLPWVLEWYTANRQYRAAYELIQDFPIKLPIKQD